MGAETRYLTVLACSSQKDLMARWAEAQAEDTYARGHDVYNGSLAHADLHVSPLRFPTKDAACKYAEDHADDVRKGKAVAYQFGDMAGAFPRTTKDIALDNLLQRLSKEEASFEHEVLKRFVASKSASKKCTHCGSVISKKSREPLAREPFETTRRGLSGFDLRDYVQAQTECPACHHNLLLTDTDLKRKKALTARLSEVKTKHQAARTEYLSKVKPYGYFIFAIVPS